MKCEECEYRFICFTTKERPIRIKVNWTITSSCARCRFAEFGNTSETYRGRRKYYSRTTKKNVGLCSKHNYLVHIKSTCPDFEPKNVKEIDTVYDELRKELGSKKRGSKIPKYCERENDDRNP